MVYGLASLQLVMHTPRVLKYILQIQVYLSQKQNFAIIKDFLKN